MSLLVLMFHFSESLTDLTLINPPARSSDINYTERKVFKYLETLFGDLRLRNPSETQQPDDQREW